MDNGLGQRLDIGDETRTAFVEHENDGFARLGQLLHEVTLIL